MVTMMIYTPICMFVYTCFPTIFFLSEDMSEFIGDIRDFCHKMLLLLLIFTPLHINQSKSSYHLNL
jgi:hypothetical protein